MLHQLRKWGVSPCEELEELAHQLTRHTWTLCTAFRTAKGTIWANDSTSPDHHQEYGVLRRVERSWHQVESITVSWCDQESMLEYLERADQGDFDGTSYGEVSPEQLEANHRSCHLCR